MFIHYSFDIHKSNMQAKLKAVRLEEMFLSDYTSKSSGKFLPSLYLKVFSVLSERLAFRKDWRRWVTVGGLPGFLDNSGNIYLVHMIQS